jgi:hypothetical protein
MRICALIHPLRALAARYRPASPAAIRSCAACGGWCAISAGFAGNDSLMRRLRRLVRAISAGFAGNDSR